MLTLLERNISTIEDRLVLLAPPHRPVPASFMNVTEDPNRRGELVADMQRLRGGVYLSDGAVRRDQLSPDGLHQTPEDERSWHLVMLNGDGHVNSCVWYMEHEQPLEFARLRVRNCPLARRVDWRDQLRRALGSELERASSDGLRYAEVGGWAVSKDSRCTAEGLLLALATYGLGRFFGGALGLTTATVRHGSSAILRRLGGSPLEHAGATVPNYYDPRYDCQMELLRFDSRRTNPKYDGLIDLLRAKLAQVHVFASVAQSSASVTAPNRQVA